MEAKLAELKFKYAKLKMKDGYDSDTVVKRKEADKVVFDKLPTIPKFRTWENKRHRILTGASGRPQEMNVYLLENADKTFEELATIPRKWQSLDDKEASAYMDIIQGDLAVEIVDAGHGVNLAPVDRSRIGSAQPSRDTSSDTPAAGKRAINASPIAAAGVNTPRRSESLSRSSANARPLSPSSTEVAL